MSLLDHFDGLVSGAPPDTAGAAGPNSYIESVNYSVAIYNKSTNAVIASDNLNHFFYTTGGLTKADANGGQADTTMVYDEPIGRFIIAGLDLDRTGGGAQAPSQVDFAVSKSSSPTALDSANWTFYTIGTTEGTAWSDYPGNIGYNHDALVFTWNMIGTSHVLVDALSQSDLAAGGTVNYTYFDRNGTNWRPVTMHDSSAGDPMWFVTEHGDNKSIDLKRVDNILNTSTLSVHSFNIPVNSYGGVNNPLQPDGKPITTNTNGSKIMKAAERYSDIVASQQIGVGSTENDARWYELNVSNINSPFLVQQGNVSAGNNTYLMMPGIDINPAGDIGMSYIRSGNDTSTDYMSVWVTGHKVADALGTMEAPVEVRAGDSNDDGDGREGDLSGINIDPNDGTFWIANEYASGGSGATEVANFAMNTQNFNVVNGQLQIYGDQLGSNYNDSITINVNGRGGVYASLNGEAASFDPGQITSIYIDPRGGTNTVQIYNVPAGAEVDVTGDGVNNVTVGNAGTGVQGINSNVFVYNGYPTPSSTGWSTLTIDDAADSVGRNATEVDQAYGVGSYQRGYITGLAPAAIEWFDNSAGTYTGGVESLTIDTGSGGNTFNMQEDSNLYNGTSLVGHSYSFDPDDVINIGNSGSVQGITGYLSISNPTGYDAITLDDSADGTARTITMASGSITGLAPAIISYATGDFHSLTVKTGGSGGNTVNILSSSQTTNVVGHAPLSGPDDVINIGNSGSVQGITGTLNLSNPPGFDAITIDDSADSTATTTTITSSSVTGLAPGTINYVSGDSHSLTVKTGSSGGNTVNVQSTGTTTSVVGSAPFGGPDDTINIGNSGSVQGITGTLNLSNPPGFDNITVDDSADTTARTITMASGSVTGLAPAAINYATGDFHSLTVKTGSSGGNTVNILSSSRTTSVVGSAPIGGPDDVINIGNSGSVQGITGTLNLSNPPGYDDITIDDSADTTATTTTITSSAVTGLAPGTINYLSSDTHSLTVKTGTASGDTVNVQGTGVTTNVVGNNNEVVNVGNSGSTQSIFGNVNVSNGSTSYTSLTVNDSADATAQTVAMNDGSMTGLETGAVTWAPTASGSGGVAYVHVLGGSGGNTFNINNTSSLSGYTWVETGSGNDTTNILGAKSSLYVYTGSGNDGVNVKATGTGSSSYIYNSGGADTVTLGSLAPSLGGALAGISGYVDVYGASGATAALIVDDSGDHVSRTATLTSSQLTGLGSSGTIAYDSTVTALTVYGPTAASTFNIQSTASGRSTTINGGVGTDTFNVVSSSKDLTNLQGALTLNGGSGTDTVNVNDSSASSGESYMLTSTSLDRVGTATITFGTVEKLNFTGGNNGNTLTATSLPTFTTVLNLGSGTNTLVGPSAATTWTIKGPNTGTLGSKVTFSNAQYLQGGTAADTFSFFGASASISGTITGSGGSDKLSYASNGGGAVTVNLGTGAATSVTGGITDLASHFTSLTGSTSTANQLIAANATNSWSITGANAGKVNAVSFTKFANLVGGSGVDTFKFASTSGTVTSINGGGGGDWLDYTAFGTTSPVTVDLVAGSATNVNGGAPGAISNIQNVAGGNGGNTLKGNGGNILIGGSGADKITNAYSGTSASGRSILIGVGGADTIIGGTAGDILIAGTSTYDAAASRTKLVAILGEWQSTADSFTTRMDKINDGTITGFTGVKLLSGSTVTNDANTVVNHLTGKGDGTATSTQNFDWFFDLAGTDVDNHTSDSGSFVNNYS